MSDKRRDMRFKVNKVAFLYTREMRSIQCIVTDLSVGGARLSLHERDEKAIDSIALMMADEWLVYPCQVRWHIDCLLGVQFTGQPDFVGAPAEEILEATMEVNLFQPREE